MATRNITTRIALDGEAEYKRQMAAVNSELKTLQSSLRLNTSEFRTQANSIQALESRQKLLQQQYDQQREKVRALTAAMEDVSQVYRDQPQTIDRYQRMLNEATIRLNAMDDELQVNARYLAEARSSADGCATSIDQYGNRVQAAQDKSEGFGGALGDLIGQIPTGVGAFTAIAGAVGTAVGRLSALETETREYRQDLSRLDTDAEAAGNSLGLIREEYSKLEALTGESDSSIEALANLMRTGFSDSQITQVVRELSGAVVAFPDTLKIESLADGLQETVATGSAVGQFSELLERCGMDLELFDAAMAEAQTQSQRLDIALQALSRTGMGEIYDSYAQTNREALALEEAELRLQDAQARLGETVVPLKTAYTELRTELIDYLVPAQETAQETMAGLRGELEQTSGVQQAIDRYRELSAQMEQGGMSAQDLTAATEDLDAAKQALIAASGGVVTALGFEDGSYIQQIDTLEKLTAAEAAYLETKLRQAAYDALAGSNVREYAKAQVEYQELNQRMDDLLAQKTDKLNQMTDPSLNPYEIQLLEDGIEGLDITIRNTRDSMGELSEEMAQYEANQQAAASTLQYLIDGGFMTADEACASFGLTLDELNSLMASVPEAAAEPIAAIADMNTSIQALNTEYQAAYQTAYESLGGQVGLWEAMPETVAASIEEIKANIDTQLGYYEQYNANLTELMERTVTDINGLQVDTSGLISALSDGSQESAAILAGLVDATDEEIAALVQSMSGADQARQNLATTMAEAQTDYEHRMQEIVNSTEEMVRDIDQSEAAYDSGVNTLQGYIAGAESMEGLLGATMTRIANSALTAWRAAWAEQSPSRRMRESGVNAMRGEVLGIQDMRAQLDATMAETAGSAIAAWERSMRQSSPSMGGVDTDISAVGGLSRPDVGRMLATAVNASALQSQAPSGDLVIEIPINGERFYRATIQDFRRVDRASPEVSRK